MPRPLPGFRSRLAAPRNDYTTWIDLLAMSGVFAAFVLVRVAELWTITAPDVGDVMWTRRLCWVPIVPQEQVRTPEEMLHPASEFTVSIVQTSPPFAGRVSVSVTP